MCALFLCWWLVIPIALSYWACTRKKPTSDDQMSSEIIDTGTILRSSIDDFAEAEHSALHIAEVFVVAFYEQHFSEFVRSHRGQDTAVTEETRVTANSLSLCL